MKEDDKRLARMRAFDQAVVDKQVKLSTTDPQLEFPEMLLLLGRAAGLAQGSMVEGDPKQLLTFLIQTAAFARLMASESDALDDAVADLIQKKEKEV